MTNDKQIRLLLYYVYHRHVGVLLFIVGLTCERQSGPRNVGAEAWKEGAIRIGVFLFPYLFVSAPS